MKYPWSSSGTSPPGTAFHNTPAITTMPQNSTTPSTARFMKNVVSEEPNVRQVALKVQLGEADAAVVYSSDVTPALKARVQAVALPGRFAALTPYPVGVTLDSRSAPQARAFVAYLLSADGQRILRKWGFRSAR